MKSYGSSLLGGIIILKWCRFLVILNVINSRCESRPVDGALRVLQAIEWTDMCHLIKHCLDQYELISSNSVYKKCYLPLRHPCQAHAPSLLLQLF